MSKEGQSDRAATADRLTVDVVVIGGGLVGLTIGIALGGAGLETAVIDGVDPAVMQGSAFDGRVCSIAQGSKRVLEGLGVWAGVARDAEPILEIRVSDGDAPLFLHYDHAEVGADPLGHIVENRHMRQALHARAQALSTVRYLAPVAVEGFTVDGHRVEAALADGRVVRARLAIAADGRHSRTRAAANIDTVHWSYPQTGIVCTVAHERPHRGIAHERFLPAGPFAILPMRGDRSSLVWTEHASLAPTLVDADPATFHRELARRFGDFLGTLEVVGPRWSYPLALTHAKRYVGERLALVGDAAHAIHPIAGQGFNLGIRDVAALAEMIVDRARLGLDIGSPDMLRGYERWRRFDTIVLVGVTDGLNRLFSNERPLVGLARDIGLAAVNQVPPLKRTFMRHAMGLVGELPRLTRGEPL